MSAEEWYAWAEKHESPITAKRVVEWLIKWDADEALWRMVNPLIDLVDGKEV